MKAFRNMPYPCNGPNSEEIYSSRKNDFPSPPPPPSSMIVAASRMLIYLQSLQGRPVQNSEIKFYKGFFRKKKKKRNIKSEY